MFPKKMSVPSELIELRHSMASLSKGGQVDYLHRYLTEKEAKRIKESERRNESRRLLIAERLSQSRLQSARRVQDIKRSQAYFEIIRDSLPPTIEKVNHEKWLEKEQSYADQVLESKREQNRSIGLDEIKTHGKKLECVLKQREVKEYLAKSETIGRESFDPLKFKKYKDNPVFKKQERVINNHIKSFVYADTVQKTVDQRSSPSAIRDWLSAHNDRNFGLFYKEMVNKRRQDRLLNWDPNSYMHEGNELARRKNFVHNPLWKSSSEKSTVLDQTPKLPLTYKEIVAKEVDYSKVNNQDVTNKTLNQYERLERAKKFIVAAKPSKSASPAVTLVDGLAEQAIRSRNPNVFKKYLNTLQYLERKVVQREQMEIYESKHSQPILPKGSADSIDLLSSCIKSKLKIMSGS